MPPQILTAAQLDQLQASLLGRVNLRPRSITEDKLAVGAASAAIVRDGSISDIHIRNLSVATLDGGTIEGEIIILDAGGTIRSADYVADTSGWAIFADGSAEFQDVIVRGELYADVGSEIGGDYITDGDLAATLDLTTAGSISGNYVAGFTGWAIDGNGDAEFNDATFRGDIAGGTIDIGTDAFQVDASGNMWLGGATYAVADFRVSAGGVMRCTEVEINSGWSYFGEITGSSTYITLSSSEGLALVSGGIVSPEVQMLLTATGQVDIYMDSVMRLYTTDSSHGAGDSTNIQFFDGAVSPARNGYIGYAGNDDMRIWNEEPAGNLFIATDGAARITVLADGDISFGSSSSPGEVFYAFYNEWDNNPCLQVLNRSPTNTESPGGIYVYLGAVGGGADPGNDDDFMRFRKGDNTVVGSIDGNGSGGVRYNTTSDRKLKENITKDPSVGAAAFDKVPWRSFTWKATGEPGHGVIAQQLAKIPEWAHAVKKGGTVWDNDPETKKRTRSYKNWSVDYVPFIGAIAAKLVDVDRRLKAVEERHG